MLKDEPLIMYNTDSVQNQTLLSIFDSIKVKPHVILNASQLYTIQAFVQKNLGGAILYSSLLKNMHGIKGSLSRRQSHRKSDSYGKKADI